MGRFSPKALEGVVRDEETARLILGRLLSYDRPLVGFDTETTGWDPKAKVTPYSNAHCAVFSLADGLREEAWCLDGTLLEVFRPLFGSPVVDWCGVNLKFDAAVLWNHGIDFDTPATWWDARLLSRLHHDTALMAHGLKQMSAYWLKQDMVEFGEIARIPGSRKKPDTDELLWCAPYEFAAYSRADALQSVRLVKLLREKTRHQDWHDGLSMEDFYRDFEEPYTRVLLRMERRGIRVDQERLAVIRKQVERERGQLQDQLDQAAGEVLDLNSPDQIERFLFKTLGLTATRTTGTKRCGVCGKKATRATGGVCRQHGDTDLVDTASTNKFALDDLVEGIEARGENIPTVRQLMRYRKIDQLWKNFLPGLGKPGPDGKVRTTWNQGSVETWRLSSSAPNLQNISRPENDDPEAPDPMARGFGLRWLFQPDPGYSFVVADESQVELRLGAHLSGDPVMVETYRQGGDIHAEAAIALFGLTCSVKDVKRLFPAERDRSKQFNFGVLYGAGKRRVAALFRISEDEAAQRIEAYYARFCGIPLYKKRVEHRVRQVGYLRSLLGRYRHFPLIHRVGQSEALQRRLYEDRDLRGRYSAEFREAINFGEQGGTADIMQTCMLVIDGEVVDWHPLQEDHRLQDMGAQQLLQVHDEVVLQVPTESAPRTAEVVKQIMTNPIPGLKVSVLAESGWGPSWPKAKKG